MVASDRISTYDVVHPTPIPDKGDVLTALSVFWFALTEKIVANHFLSATEGVPDDVRGRAMAVRKLAMLPVECVVRGYITGSGWKDYQATGAVSGIELPPGLLESQQLPEPIFTPSTKAEVGHDEAIDFERAVELVGDRELMARVRDASIALYTAGAEHAREHGIILADTKFEFGLDDDGELVVGDEVLTPDSSRYWPADGYEPGRGAAVVRQAVRARLGGGHRLGQEAAGAGDPRRRRVAARGRCTSRPTSASAASRSRRGSSGQRREGARACAAQGRHPRSAGHRRASGRCRRSASRASTTSTSDG